MRLLIALILLGALSSAYARDLQGSRSAFVVVEAGRNPQGMALFTVQADSAEITSLLKELFRKGGIEQFSIDQDVAGPVDLRIKNATVDQIFKEVTRLTRPPIKIARQGDIYRVSRDLEAAVRTQFNGGGPPPVVDISRVPNVLNPYQALQPGERLVTLDVPKNQPIPLADALARISAQTGVMIRLDRRIPRDVTFTGTVTNARLGYVIQTIADTSDLKLVWDTSTGMQAMLVPPDRFLIRVNEFILGQSQANSCPRCGQRVISEWLFCPRCGQAVNRNTRTQSRPNIQRIQPKHNLKLGGLY